MNKQSHIYIFHTLYWISQQLLFLYIYLKSMRSISDVVYLLPLLFSPIANLGQLYATSHYHWTAWLLLCAKLWCLKNERHFVVKINVLWFLWLHIHFDVDVNLLKSALVFILKRWIQGKFRLSRGMKGMFCNIRRY